MDRKATEHVYAVGKYTEGVEDWPDSADVEEERGGARARKASLLSQVMKLLERV